MRTSCNWKFDASKKRDFDLHLIGFDDVEMAKLLAARGRVLGGLTDEDSALNFLKPCLRGRGSLDLGLQASRGRFCLQRDVHGGRKTDGRHYRGPDVYRSSVNNNVDYSGTPEEKMKIQGTHCLRQISPPS